MFKMEQQKRLKHPIKGNLVWGLTPFYYDRKAPDFQDKVACLKRTMAELRRNVDRIAVVDDGAGLSEDQLGSNIFLQLPTNQGKAEAIRVGVRAILAQSDYPAGYILQIDSDLDQNPSDASLLVQKIIEQKIEPTRPAIIVGDRYYPGSVSNKLEYRQSMLLIQEALSSKLGYSLRDYVSGFRVYTRAYAEQFLDLSASFNFGVETEQIIIAFLIRAKVGTVSLTYSRSREPFTSTDKLLQNLDAILMHADALNNHGLEGVVGAFEKIRKYMQQGNNSFKTDLNSLNLSTNIRFKRLPNNKMTATFLER